MITMTKDTRVVIPQVLRTRDRINVVIFASQQLVTAETETDAQRGQTNERTSDHLKAVNFFILHRNDTSPLQLMRDAAKRTDERTHE